MPEPIEHAVGRKKEKVCVDIAQQHVRKKEFVRKWLLLHGCYWLQQGGNKIFYYYEGAMNAELFKSFKEEHFPGMFEKSANPRGKLFLQDGDPSQNSKLSCKAVDQVRCRLFKIPPRS